MVFFVDLISVWIEICKKCSIVVLFGRHQIFSMFTLRGILVCSVKMLVLFSHMILYYRLISFRKAMQLYFLSFSSSSLFFLEVVVKSFDYFENQMVCFTSFVLAVFWCSTSNAAIVVLWKMLMQPVNAPARWWPCACLNCVSGLRRLEKTLNFLICICVFDLVLKYGSDINEGNWLQLLFYFIVLIGIVVSVVGMSFLQLCFRF